MVRKKAFSLADQVYEKIEDDIINGVLERGSIVTEGHLAAELGISRTPVREAITRLEHDHMVKETGMGIEIIGITDEDAECIYDIRERVEGLSSALAAQKATDEQLAEMKEILDLQKFYIEKHDFDNAGEMNKRFHDALNEASQSPILYNLLVGLHNRVRRYRKNATHNEADALESYGEHEMMYKAVEKRDPIAAETAAINHVKHARIRMQNAMKGDN